MLACVVDVLRGVPAFHSTTATLGDACALCLSLCVCGCVGDGAEVREGYDHHSWFGKAQIITRDPASGVLCAGSDGRGDGCAMGW